MGEYIQYKGDHVKLGTCENLYYSTYQQFLVALRCGQLFRLPNNDYPSNYALPDSGYRFRFPFPDEKNIEIGNYDDYHRGVPVKIDSSLFPEYEKKDATFIMEITQQKLAHRESDGQLCLMLVWRDPESKTSFRIEEAADMKNVIKQMIKYSIANNPDPQQKEFFRQIAVTILKGYNMPNQNVSLATKNDFRKIPPSVGVKQNHRKGKGI